MTLAMMNTGISTDLSAMIANVGANKESTKMEISNLRRDVDLYRRQAKTLLGQGFSAENFRKFRHCFKSFSQEIHSRVGEISDREDNEPEESYNVLRSSLGEAQKRCELMNENMLKVADANGDLVHTLGSLKNANRRLVDQLEQQSSEVASLEQHAVLGEEKIINLHRMQNEEMDQWRSEAQFKLDDYTKIQNEEFEKMEEKYKNKIAKSIQALALVSNKAHAIGEAKCDLGENVQDLAEKMSKTMQLTLHDLSNELESLGKTRRAETTGLKDVVHNLEVKLTTERDLHQQDVALWTSRVNKAENERDDTNARMEHEQDRLQSELEKVETTGEQQHVIFQTASKELSCRSEELAGDIASLTAMIEVARCKATQLLNRSDVLERDIVKVNDTLGRTGEDCIDLEASLQDAVQNYGQLNQQMGQLRADAQQENERDLGQCRELYDRKLELLATSHNTELHFYEEESNRLSNTLSACTTEEMTYSNKMDSLMHQRTMLQRVCVMWKQHYEDSVKHSQATADDYKQSKLQWDKTHKEIDERRTDVIVKSHSAQQSVDQLKEEIAAYQAASKDHIHTNSKHAESLSAAHFEAEEALEETLHSLKETSARLQMAKSEIAQEESSGLQKQNELIRELDARAKQHEDTMKAYEQALVEEHQLDENLGDQFHRLKDENQSQMKRWSEIPQTKIQYMEREMDEIANREKAELAQLTAQNNATLREISALSGDYTLYQRQSRLHDDAPHYGHPERDDRRPVLSTDLDITPPKVSRGSYSCSLKA
eukprot:GEMP01002427.1.p1 GENE.GEMP01002427.1~~GEMP01002427.1.p1  ORF type:complete len:773 (+),score=196.90 GEMP01002427.1:215-2533(+)